MMAKKAQEKKLSGFGQLKGTSPLDAVVEKKIVFFQTKKKVIFFQTTAIYTGSGHFFKQETSASEQLQVPGP